MEPLRVLALIPARGGSKGLSGKNIRPLAGKSLIERAFECARDIKESGSYHPFHG